MEKILMGKGEDQVFILPKMINRHGLISGATGTGKTITLKVLAEALSDMGVPTFIPDVKGDLTGLLKELEMNDKIQERINTIGIENFTPKKYPVRFWDVLQKKGHPIRTTISEMGPLLLAQILDLNDTQEGVLNIAFKYADDHGLLLLDLKDLKAILNHISEESSNIKVEYGNVSSQSIGAIQRALLVLEGEGGDLFFGEPALQITDFLQVNEEGKGFINLLNAVDLHMKPRLYSAFLLWFISELYEELPEVGDAEKPKMVFFFDEAHLLFANGKKALIEKLEQTIKLIRSKGVGIFFVTQNPIDIPDSVLAQLGNRVQHSLRAFTPKEQKAVKTISQTFVQNPNIDTEKAILELKTGEALVSFLDEDGKPQMVERALISPPRSYIGVADEAMVISVINNSPFAYKYTTNIDRESAYEILKAEVEKKAQLEEEMKNMEAAEKERVKLEKEKAKNKSLLERSLSNMLNSASRSIGSSIGRSILGTIKKSFK